MSDFALISRQGGSEQRFPLLPPGPLQVGRLEGCEVLLDNKQVSRRHARLEWNAVAGGWLLWERIYRGEPLTERPMFFVVVTLFLAALMSLAMGFVLELLSDAVNGIGPATLAAFGDCCVVK